MTDVRVPHFAFPLRFVNGAAVVNEQDSLDDIRDCVRAILSYPVGSRIEAPEFGVPDQTFVERGADPAAVIAAVQRWEPRADLAAQADNSNLADLITRLIVEVAEEGTRR